MKQIAIVYVHLNAYNLELDNQYYDSISRNTMLIDSVTDWTEVSDADYDILVRAGSAQSLSQKTPFWVMLTKAEDSFIVDTVAKHIKKIKQEQAEITKRQKERDEANRLRMEKALKTKAARDLKKLKQLAEKYPGEISQNTKVS